MWTTQLPLMICSSVVTSTPIEVAKIVIMSYLFVLKSLALLSIYLDEL